VVTCDARSRAGERHWAIFLPSMPAARSST
jgi:hypothetical protein